MKVLWFTNTPSNYISTQKGYNGGGWISSLEKEIKQSKSIELGISFFLIGQPKKIIQDRVIYYPMLLPHISVLKKIAKFVTSDMESIRAIQQDKYIQQLLDVIEDFKPNLIHVFGSEEYFGLIGKYTSIPVVLHIQGILNPYLNAFLPPFVSWHDYYFSNLNPISIYRNFLSRIYWKRSCEREREIIKSIKYYLGRTIWDKRVVKILNPDCAYYYCSEILRDAFYESVERSIPDQLMIVSTISFPFYKGFDLILKTAYMLKFTLGLDFTWKVFGNVDPQLMEKKMGIKSRDVNIQLMGVATAEQVKEAILNSTVFVHSSYIDNSPNSVCEAQLLGCSVISTNVGGISSLIENNKTGFLVPANDPYQISYLIRELYNNRILNMEIGLSAREIAWKRHSKTDIVAVLLSIYENIAIMHAE